MAASNEVRNRAASLISYLANEGFTPAAIQGIYSNLYWESGGTLDPNIKEGGGGSGRGIAQWSSNGRWLQLQSWTTANKMDPYSIEGQTAFLVHEMKGIQSSNGQSLYDSFRQTGWDPVSATGEFLRKFEKPLDQSAAAVKQRLDSAKELWSSLTGSTTWESIKGLAGKIPGSDTVSDIVSGAIDTGSDVVKGAVNSALSDAFGGLKAPIAKLAFSGAGLVMIVLGVRDLGTSK